MQTWAGIAGYKHLASYLRITVLEQAAPRAAVPKSNRLKWGELARLSANLNQLTEHLNKGNIIESPSVIRLLDQNIKATRQELKNLRNELIGVAENDPENNNWERI